MFRRYTSIMAFILAIVLAMATMTSAAPRRRFNPVSRHPIQPQHSLASPTDQSQVYWSFGGSTALTKKFVRLVPATQNREGWLWNEYPIERDRFEVEFVFEVNSRQALGGEGFAMWFLNAKENTGNDVESLKGPIFGMHERFKGVGIIFDVYDNDGRRNNPMIGVIRNDGRDMNFQPQNDFESNFVTKQPISGIYRHDSYRCQIDFRNLGRKVRALVKAQKRHIHLYLNTEDGNGWKLCLAVDVGAYVGVDAPSFSTFKDMHIAFTASTGQVADAIDLYEVNTRYLALSQTGDSGDGDMDYAELASESTQWGLFLLVISTIALLAFSFNDFSDYRSMAKNRIDSAVIANRVNQTIKNQFYAHVALTVVFIITGWWFMAFINLPLAIIRAIQFKAGVLTISPSAIGRIKSSGFGILGLSIDIRFIIALATHIFTFIYLAVDLLL